MSTAPTIASPQEKPASKLYQNGTLIRIDIAPDDHVPSPAAVELEMGKAYRFDITRLPGGDPKEGGRNNQFMAPEFFQNAFIYEAKIAGLEVKTRTLDYLEFDVPGTVRLTLVPTRVGSYPFWVSGSRSLTTGTFNVR